MSVYSEHCSPPLEGAGLLHGLDLVCIPPSQLEEHSDHDDKFPRPPSTENRDMYPDNDKRYFSFCKMNPGKNILYVLKKLSPRSNNKMNIAV